MRLQQKKTLWYEMEIPKAEEAKVRGMLKKGFTTEQVFVWLEENGYGPEYTQVDTGPEPLTPLDNGGEPTMELVVGGIFDQKTVWDNSLGVDWAAVLADAKEEIEGLLDGAEENSESQVRIEYLKQLLNDIDKLL